MRNFENDLLLKLVIDLDLHSLWFKRSFNSDQFYLNNEHHLLAVLEGIELLLHLLKNLILLLLHLILFLAGESSVSSLDLNGSLFL